MDIGPCLPPGFKLQTGRTDDSNSIRKDIGPQMPPSFQRRTAGSDSDSESDSSDSNDETTSANRQRISQPDHKLKHKHCDRQDSHSDSDTDENVDRSGSIGPIRPPNLEENKLSKRNSGSASVVGPALSPGLKDRQGHSPGCDSSDGLHGPALPPHMLMKHGTSPSRVIGPAHRPAAQQGIDQYSSDDSDEGIGPRLPSASDVDLSSTAREIERRAEAMRDRLTNKDTITAVPQRESWMTELPTSMKQDLGLGLTARTFRSGPASAAASRNDNDEDRSAWTDTPADRDKKEKEGSATSSTKRKHSKDKHTRDRDKRLAKEVEKYNKEKRGDSLLAMHQKKMNKKKKKEKEKKNERREFDRDSDLQVNRFDDAQRRALIKKSQELNTRFGHGASQFM